MPLVKYSWLSIPGIAQSGPAFRTSMSVILQYGRQGPEDWAGVPADQTLMGGQQEAGGPEGWGALRQGLGHGVGLGAGRDIAHSFCVGNNSVLY